MDDNVPLHTLLLMDQFLEKYVTLHPSDLAHKDFFKSINKSETERPIFSVDCPNKEGFSSAAVPNWWYARRPS